MDRRTIRHAVAAGLVALVAVAVAFVAIGAAGAGVPAPADQYGGRHDSLQGSATRLSLAGEPSRVNVSAFSGPNGENAHGTFQVIVQTADLGPVMFRGKVDCLTVEGNRAAARGTVERSTAPPIVVGTDYQIQVTDNKASGTPDTNINFYGFEPGDAGCPIIPFDEVPITSGNFRVHDTG
jgi:hypothetical protein